MSALGTVAGRIHAELQGGGSRGFDLNTILDILKTIFGLFAGCKLAPKKAHERALNVAAGRGVGHRLDRLRLRRVVTGRAPDDQADEYEAAVLDAVDNTSEQEFGACMAEVQAP